MWTRGTNTNGANFGLAGAYLWETSASVSVEDLQTVTVNQSNVLVTDLDMRLLVNIGGDVYVSDTLWSSDVFPDIADQATIDALNWYNYTPGTIDGLANVDMRLTTSSAVGTALGIGVKPVGTITTIGIAFDGMGDASNKASFNQSEFIVTAVPEPSTFALLGGLCAFAYVALRRRNA